MSMRVGTIFFSINSTIFTIVLFSYGTSAYKERFWHEEYFKPGEVHPELVKSLESKIIYPLVKICVRPQQETKISKRKSLSQPSKSQEVDGRWSQFLGLYFFDFGYEIHNWEETREKKDPEVEPWTESASLFFILFLLILYLVLCMIIIPIIGGLGFNIFRVLWCICSHPCIRNLSRRFWIYNELRKRRRTNLLYHWDKGKVPKHLTRLPNWLRSFKEEEIPAELVENDVDSDSGESTDGFELEDKEQSITLARLQKQPRIDNKSNPHIQGHTHPVSLSAKKLLK